MLCSKCHFPMSQQCFPSPHLGMTGMYHVDHRHYQVQCFTLLFIVQLVSAFHDSVMFMLSYLIRVSLDITIEYRSIVVFHTLYFTSSLSVRRATQFSNVQAVYFSCLQPPCASFNRFSDVSRASPQQPSSLCRVTVHCSQYIQFNGVPLQQHLIVVLS